MSGSRKELTEAEQLRDKLYRWCMEQQDKSTGNSGLQQRYFWVACRDGSYFRIDISAETRK